jgi:hypothetical protein
MHAGEALALTQRNDWVTPSLLNSWVYYGAPYNTPGFYRDAIGTVHLRGMIKNGTLAAAAFTLPSGYRPVAQELHPVVSNGAFGLITLLADGTVHMTTVNNTYVSLDGITFRAVP